MKTLNEELNVNTTSIVTTLGGGAHVHLALTISPAMYPTLSNTAFTIPTLPAAVNTVGQTGPQIAALNRVYDKEKAEFHSYVNLQNALKKQLIAAIEPLYLQALRAPYVGFANVTVYDMLRHLYDTYANISADNLDENDKRLKAPWDPNAPFESFIKQVQDAITLSDHAGVPYTNKKVINIAYQTLEQTGSFEHDC